MKRPSANNPYTSLTSGDRSEARSGDDPGSAGDDGPDETGESRFESGPMRRSLSVFAVLMGVGVDWGLTKLTVPRYLDWVQATHGPDAFLEVLAAGPLRWAWSGLGWSCSVVGGFVTGWLAGRKELLHGLGNLLLTATLIRLEAFVEQLPLTPDKDFLIAQTGNVVSILLGAQLALWLRRFRQRAR